MDGVRTDTCGEGALHPETLVHWPGEHPEVVGPPYCLTWHVQNAVDQMLPMQKEMSSNPSPDNPMTYKIETIYYLPMESPYPLNLSLWPGSSIQTTKILCLFPHYNRVRFLNR